MPAGGGGLRVISMEKKVFFFSVFTPQTRFGAKVFDGKSFFSFASLT